jgi:hypothetical protein
VTGDERGVGQEGSPAVRQLGTGYRVSGTRYRIRCPAFGSRPSAWTRDTRRLYLPCPSSLHGRVPRPSRGRARSSVLGIRPSASDRLRCRVPGPRCQIAGTRYRVPGTWHLPSKNPHTGYARYRMQDGSDGVRGRLKRVPGTGFQVPVTRDPGPDQRRGPNTEHRGPSQTRPRGLHPASCILHPVSCILHLFCGGTSWFASASWPVGCVWRPPP